MNNFLLEPETDPAIISHILRRQVKESRKFRPTTPFHSERKCEDKSRCAFHRRRHA